MLEPADVMDASVSNRTTAVTRGSKGAWSAATYSACRVCDPGGTLRRSTTCTSP